MDFISSKAAAEKWGVSLRNVQRLLTEKRIPGAKRYGNYWMIPADAKKPEDPRRERKQSPSRPFETLPKRSPLLTMTTLYRKPGSGDAVAKSLKSDPEAHTLFCGQLAYLRGDISGAEILLRELPYTQERPDLLVGTAFLHSLCALYQGRVAEWTDARQKVEKMACLCEKEAMRRDFWLGNFDLELYDIDSFPAWFCEGEFEHLPADCFPMARYAYMKYHMLHTMKSDAALITKPFISQNILDGALVSEIYCRLMLAVGYHEQGAPLKAAEQIDIAFSLARPDRLYAPFAEYRDNLETLLDDRLNQTDKEAAKTVKELNLQLSRGWTKLKREIHGMVNTTELTQQEHYAAKLAAKGLTNAEISGRMSVSVNTVRGYISEAIGKTGAGSRKELSRFLAMEEKKQ